MTNVKVYKFTAFVIEKLSNGKKLIQKIDFLVLKVKYM